MVFLLQKTYLDEKIVFKILIIFKNTIRFISESITSYENARLYPEHITC